MYSPKQGKKVNMNQSVSLDSLKNSFDTLLYKETPHVKSAFKDWVYIRTAITVFILVWGVGFSVTYALADENKRRELEYLDNVWMGHKHDGFLVWIFKLWILTVIGLTVVNSFPQIKSMLM